MSKLTTSVQGSTDLIALCEAAARLSPGELQRLRHLLDELQWSRHEDLFDDDLDIAEFLGNKNSLA